MTKAKATEWLTKQQSEERERVRDIVVDLDAWEPVGGTWSTRVPYGDEVLWVMLLLRCSIVSGGRFVDAQSAHPRISIVVSEGPGVWVTFDKMVPEVRALFQARFALWACPEWIVRHKVVQ